MVTVFHYLRVSVYVPSFPSIGNQISTPLAPTSPIIYTILHASKSIRQYHWKDYLAVAVLFCGRSEGEFEEQNDCE